ncbi:hypothetical protein NHF40_11805 [Maricaulaceae bacterium EIL42A08]|nr:hypothetical protein [Maricaulaceae bacterium EIL42A08]MCP2678145.1 hypothetical protein [Maricaulaceae bacterium NA33B04]
MLRFILLMAAMFALPFIAWHLWRLVQSPETDQAEQAPATTLAIIGVVLALLATVTLALVDGPGVSRDGRYEPPRVVNGEVQPGRFVPDEGDNVPEDPPGDG